MRINLRKINQLIREAWRNGQKDTYRGGGKSSCYYCSYQVARDFFPNISPIDAARIGQGQARLHWDTDNNKIVIVSTTPLDTRTSSDTDDD